MANIDIKTGVPTPLANDFLIGQVVNFVDTRTKACRADHRAVRARQASCCDIVPMGIFQLRQQSIPYPVRIQMFSNLLGSPGSPFSSPLELVHVR